MQKTILITGSTDGIGLETAKSFVQQGHLVLIHGRNSAKLESALSELQSKGEVVHPQTSRLRSRWTFRLL